ncbi:MAG: peptidoglycan editing factor PgeF [Mariprofundaceae bacterium]
MPEQENADYIRSNLMVRHGFSAIFSLRSGGISPPPFASLNLGLGLGDKDANIEVNLGRLLKATALQRPHQAKQVHGNQALICSGPGRHHDTEADILISPSGDPLAVRIADCLPILIADSQSGMTAAIHAGWRGTVARVAAYAAARMIELGASVEHLLAVLGPCISPCCFTIDNQTARQLAACTAGAERHITGTSPHDADLKAINILQLRQAGIAAGNIDTQHACTHCDTARFYSHRRDGGKTGRHLAIIATNPSSAIAEVDAHS